MGYTGVTHNKSEILDLGSGYGWFKKTTSAAADLTVPDTYGQLPVFKDSKLVPSISEKSDTTEGNSKIVTGVEESWKLDATFMQSSKAVLFNIWDEGKLGYGIIIKEMTETDAINGNFQYYAILGRLVSFGGVELPARRPTFGWEAQKAPADITINLETATLTGATATLTGETLVIGAGKYWGMVEIAEA